MIPSSISSSFRVQINRKLNSHQFCPLNFLNPTYGSKVIKFQKDGKGCIRIQMLYTFKKVCSIIQRCCKEFLSCLTIIFLKFYFTPALKYIITNISRSQWIFWPKKWFLLDVLPLNLVPFLIRFVVRLKLKLNILDKLKYQPSGAGGTRLPPAMPHRLQIQNGRQWAQKWPTGSGKLSTPRFLGILSNFR